MKEARKNAAKRDEEQAIGGTRHYKTSVAFRIPMIVYPFLMSTVSTGLQILSTYSLQGHLRYLCGRPLHFMIKPIANKRNSILDDVGDYGGWVGRIRGKEKVIASVFLGATGGGNAEKGKATAFTRQMPTREMRKSKGMISG
ncbi:hypothetical protein V5O48_015323 [Marasmius crinis-equi]|uniref:Uncharacterized protein n=1 Tax=Marasmius crinis-equi TaxID=585013 RepID=A0ABR3EUV4_9AGAR